MQLLPCCSTWKCWTKPQLCSYAVESLASTALRP